MLTNLTKAERLHLMRFVCSFAWADLRVTSEERAFVRRLVHKLKLHEEEARQVEKWLEVPPSPEEIDPTRVPPEHRKLFLETARKVVAADGEVTPEEKESLALLEELLGR